MSSYRISEMAKPYIEYDMIQTYTELPQFPEFRTRLLCMFLNQNASVAGNSELFALVTSLVQMGLDTHDLVNNHDHNKELKAARSRQLQVLAGSYFSSRFYNLLSQAGQIDLISTLSNAICEVNRLKMELYLSMKQWKLTAEEYLNKSVDIKERVFLAFSGLLEGAHQHIWPQVLKSYTMLEVVLQEIYSWETTQDYVRTWGFWHVLQNSTKEEKKQLQANEPDTSKLKNLWHKYNVTAQLYRMLEQQLKQLELTLSSLGPDMLVHDLLSICEPVKRYLGAPKVIEEI